MIIHVSIFGRGRALMFHQADFTRNQMVYFSWTKLRHNVVRRHFSIHGLDDGGLEVTVMNERKTQGWRLRGPIEHVSW